MSRDEIERLEQQLIAMADVVLRPLRHDFTTTYWPSFATEDSDHLGTLAVNLRVVARFATKMTDDIDRLRAALLSRPNA